MESDREEDTNLDEELRQRLVVAGRVLPDPEATAAVGECNSVELEHYMAGLKTTDLAHMMVENESGTLGIIATKSDPRVPSCAQRGSNLGQAMLYARGLPPPNHPCLADLYLPLNPGEARRSSQRLVDEVTGHCDILGRLLQAYSGETMAHVERVRAHLSRIEHSPLQVPPRRVRERTDDGPQGGVSAAASSSTGENIGANTPGGEAPQQAGTEPDVDDNGGETTAVFPWLNPGALFSDTLSSAEGGSQEVHPPPNQGEDEFGAAQEGDNRSDAKIRKT